jgi:hypothetical protein
MGRLHVMRRFSQVARGFLRLVAVAGPALLALLTALYVGRPSLFFLASGITLAVAILVCDGWIIARRHWITGGLALTTQIALVFFLGGYAASPLPAPPPLSDPLPQASPPAGMATYALPTGVIHRTSAFAYRGGSPWEKWDSVMTAVLIRHPQGSSTQASAERSSRSCNRHRSCFDWEPTWCRYRRPPTSSMRRGTSAKTCVPSFSPTRTRYPHITIVPAHDARGYASIPGWSRSALP